MNKKRIFICCISVFILMIVVGLGMSIIELQQNDIVLQMAIYPNNDTDANYSFLLIRDGTFICVIGKGRISKIHRYDIFKIHKNQMKITLSESEFNILIDIANEIEAQESGTEIQTADLNTNIIITYNDKTYYCKYSAKNSDTFANLINEIIYLSPLPVNIKS